MLEAGLCGRKGSDLVHIYWALESYAGQGVLLGLHCHAKNTLCFPANWGLPLQPSDVGLTGENHGW